MPPRLIHHGRWLSLSAAAILFSACGFPLPLHQVQASKVEVDTPETDIVFGVPKPTPAPPQAPAALPPLSNLDLGQPPLLSFNGNDFLFPLIPAIAACPTASPTAFPADVAGSDVNILPAAGDYRWAASGKYDLTVLTTTVQLPLGPFEQHQVRNAKTFTDTLPTLPGSPPPYDFTYETIQPMHGSSGWLDFHWQVKDNALGASAQGQTAGDPEAGLALMQVDELDTNAKFRSTIFQAAPHTGLLLLPLPVQPGTAWTSTSVDTSSSANNLKFHGTTGNRETVDACGTPVQAWAVDGTLTPTGTGAANPPTLHLDIATQMGALVVAVNITSDNGWFFDATYHKVADRIGQLKPDSLPAKFQ